MKYHIILTPLTEHTLLAKQVTDRIQEIYAEEKKQRQRCTPEIMSAHADEVVPSREDATDNAAEQKNIDVTYDDIYNELQL